MLRREFVINEARSAACTRARKKRELFQIALAELDVRTAIGVADDFIELMKSWPSDKGLPYHLAEAFVAHIAVSYARPFTETRKAVVPPLPRRWSRFKDTNLQRIHDLMIDVRHTLFAHTDATQISLEIVPSGVMMKGIGRPAPLNSWVIRRKTLPPHSIGDLRRRRALIFKRDSN